MMMLFILGGLVLALAVIVAREAVLIGHILHLEEELGWELTSSEIKAAATKG